MPVAWLGLALIVVLAVPAWQLARRARAAKHERTGGGAAASKGNRAPDRAPQPSGPPAAQTVPDALSAVEVFRRLNELAFGVERLGLPALDAYDAIAPEIIATLDSVATDPRYAPRRPLLLPQLLRAMRDDQVTRTELARIIARDPALAGSLLKLANGAFYRVSEKPVESVDRAVALLGTDGIRSLVATALVQPVFRLSERQFPNFPETVWDHTVRAATAAESHAAIVEDSDPFAAQLLGLTMGLGTIVVFRVALDRYTARAEMGRDKAAPNAAVIASLLEAQTGAVAARIAGSWELSDRILKALEDQIPTAQAQEPTSLGRSLRFGRLIGALALLQTADRISYETAKATALTIGAAEFQFDRIWTRLTGRREPERDSRRGRG
ncbi:MAG TPA: HDOD domain-containing protein [Steroidobacteraceae bacterium]|nr:HDOD domain-containing protein [Steroidobacteraceae bacterium]